MIKILLVDHHSIVRQGIKNILSACPDLAVVGEAADAEDTIYLNWRFEYDVVLLESSLLKKDGFDIIKLLRSERPHLGILLLNLDSKNLPEAGSSRNGFADQITSRTTPEELIHAVRSSSGATISSI